MLLVQRDFGVALGDIVGALVPPGHADGDAVAFGGQRHVLARAALRQVEGELQQAVGAVARVDRLLDHDLAVRALVHDAAQRRVFALGVLAHHEVVDIAGLAAGQRAGHALEQTHGAQVDVLVELAAELQQRTPQRNVIGYGRRPAHGAEEDRIHARQLRLPVVGHHLAVPGVIVAMRPVEGVQFQVQTEAPGGGLHGAQAFGHDFLADAVSGDHGDLVGALLLHGWLFKRCKPAIVHRGERPFNVRVRVCVFRDVDRTFAAAAHGMVGEAQHGAVPRAAQRSASSQVCGCPSGC